MADAIQAPVSGPECKLVLHNGEIVPIAGAHWHTAHPGIPPAPPLPIAMPFSINHLSLRDPQGTHRVDLADVSALEFHIAHPDGPRVQSLRDDAARMIVAGVDFSEPSRITGRPFSFETGQMRLSFRGGEVERVFIIWGDDMIQDAEFQDTLYLAGDDFAGFVRELAGLPAL